MRHGISGNRLSRNSSLRKATVRDLAKSTLIQQRVLTTKAKAKEARKLVEHLITLGKRGTLTDRRSAFAILCDHQLVSDLFQKTAPRFKNRVGGYTRIIPIGPRRGDNAQMAFLELTEIEEVVAKPKAPKKEKAAVTQESAHPEKGDKQEKKVDFSEVSKEQATKKDSIKDIKKAPDPKAGGKMGALRKFFNRKVGGGGS